MNISNVLPPGKYFIGDPSFVLDNTLVDVLAMTNFFAEPTSVMVNGLTLWGGHTQHGNRTYTDQNGVEYHVITGILAAVPLALIEDPEGEDHGTIIDAPSGLTIEFNDGVFLFDTISINTIDPLTTNFSEGYDIDPEDGVSP